MSHADQWYGTASAIKAFVLFALLRKADEEGLDLSSESIDGASIMSLATLMIQSSDNPATNTLIDYVTMERVNDEIRETLGLTVTRLDRYMAGGPSAHGLGAWFDDFQAGYDNFSTPRELVSFYRQVWENDGLLSNAARTTFFGITDLPASTISNVLNEQVPGFNPAFVQVANKPGRMTYSGSPGDFTHRPQLGEHRLSSDAGVMQFSNGDIVFYAVIVEGDEDGVYRSISCAGWEIGKDYSGVPVGDPVDCEYP